MTEEQLRIELASALVRAEGLDPDNLYQWHPCQEPAPCKARQDPRQPCACSGIPYLSDSAWNELRPVIRRIQQAAAA